MQTLPQLQSTPLPAAIADHETTLPEATAKGGESFQDVMTRALSPEDGKSSTATGPRARINAGATKKGIAPAATQIGKKADVVGTADDLTAAVKPDAKIKTKASAKPGAGQGVGTDLTAQNGSDPVIPALKTVAMTLTDSLLSASLVPAMGTALPVGIKLDDSMSVGALSVKADRMTAISGLPSAGMNSVVQKAATAGPQTAGVKTADLTAPTASGAETLATQLVAEAFSRLQSNEPQKTDSGISLNPQQSSASDLSAQASPQFPLMQAAEAQVAANGVVPPKVQLFDTQDVKPVHLAGFKSPEPAVNTTPVKDSEMAAVTPEIPAGLEAWRAQNQAPIAVAAATVAPLGNSESLAGAELQAGPAGLNPALANFQVSSGNGLKSPIAESILNGASAPVFAAVSTPISTAAPVAMGNPVLTEAPSGLDAWRAQNLAPIQAPITVAAATAVSMKSAETFAIPVAMPQATEFPVSVSFVASPTEPSPVVVNPVAASPTLVSPTLVSPAPAVFPVSHLSGQNPPAAESKETGPSAPIFAENRILTEVPSGLDAWRAQNQGPIQVADAAVTSSEKAIPVEVLPVTNPLELKVAGPKNPDQMNISMAPATPVQGEVPLAARLATSRPVEAQSINSASTIPGQGVSAQVFQTEAVKPLENQVPLKGSSEILPGIKPGQSIFGELQTAPTEIVKADLLAGSPVQAIPAAAPQNAPMAVGSQTGTEAEKILPNTVVLSNPGQASPVNPSPLASALNPVVNPDVNVKTSVINPVFRPKLEATANTKSVPQTAGQKEALKPANVTLNTVNNGGLTVPAADSPAAPVDTSVPSSPAQAGDASELKNTGSESVVHSSAKVSGTVNAKQTLSMKNMDQTNKVAGQAEKVLPGDVVSVARENNLPSRSVFSPVRPRNDSTVAGVPAVPVVSDHSVRVSEADAETVTVANGTPLRNETLERTHELVAQHALRLSELKTDSLQVVLKPGAGTQLSLELRQRGGGVEAQAVLQQGDFEHLKQRWPELQQQLEQRGIKLAPLTTSENSTAWSGGQGFQKNQQNQPEETESLPVETLARFVPARAMAARPEKLAAHAAASGGWQMWA